MIAIYGAHILIALLISGAIYQMIAIYCAHILNDHISSFFVSSRF